MSYPVTSKSSLFFAYGHFYQMPKLGDIFSNADFSILRNLQASESAILKLMDNATRIEDIVSLQRELTSIRGQIERIQGRLNFLGHSSDLSSISVTLNPDKPLPEPTPVTEPGQAWNPIEIAARAWNASSRWMSSYAAM